MTAVLHVSRKTLAAAWVGLVLLSLVTVIAGGFSHARLAALLVLLAGLGKGWLIVDHFMELRHAHPGWRLIMLAWPVVMALTIGAAFILSAA